MSEDKNKELLQFINSLVSVVDELEVLNQTFDKNQFNLPENINNKISKILKQTDTDIDDAWSILMVYLNKKRNSLKERKPWKN
jgi:hypothetical protein